MRLTGKLVDIISRDIYPAELFIKDGKIEGINRLNSARSQFILPGLIDAHIHIESSMVTPGSFARAAVSRGTTGVVSDPHEIANVLGSDGVRYMIEDSQKVPLKIYFGAPSCVPATNFETSGARIESDEIRNLLGEDGLKYLSEMMNYPGVINSDPEVMKKIEAARHLDKPVDGHAPGLRGDLLKKYISAGISTDHESVTIEEAKEKISLGMKVLIREGSAAKNLDELKSLFKSDPGMVMLCSDDLHPEMLEKGHVNVLVARLISEGFDLFDVIRSCTINPAVHYRLEAGLLRPGDPADMIMVNDLHKMDVTQTWINGTKVFGDGQVLFDYPGASHINKFNCSEVNKDQILVNNIGRPLRVIEASDGQLITHETRIETGTGQLVEPDAEKDLLKLVVKDRYGDATPAVGFIKGFNLKKGAFASSVAHDSHNIICAGTNDDDIINAINEIVRLKGGLSVSSDGRVNSLPLPVAGIMSDQPVETIAAAYQNLSGIVKSNGSKMSAPFMTLSFMTLLVIPELKLSDKGLFDGKKFSMVSLFAD